jgi:DNA-binding transcriptional ArsR family regulator
MTNDVDKVFKALADPTRRRLLDSLRRDSGQTLGALCGQLDMARQSATQHLSVLEEASLISTVRRGREKLHYLNPVPIHDIQRRWIAPFDQPRLRALDAVRRHAEEPAMTAGKPVDGSDIADVVGTVLESVPPERLVLTFGAPGAEPDAGPSAVTFLIEPYQDIVRLTVTHENLADEDAVGAVSAGWPAVLANLKSLLETGHVLPQPPWEMHAELRAAQMARNDAR